MNALLLSGLLQNVIEINFPYHVFSGPRVTEMRATSHFIFISIITFVIFLKYVNICQIYYQNRICILFVELRCIKHNRFMVRDAMKDTPMIYNPKTGVGFGGGGGVSDFRGISNPREFSKEELTNVHTHILLKLPFALHGFTGTYTIGHGIQLGIRIKENPIEVATYNLGQLEARSVKNMKLVPDNWGCVNFTNAIFDFPVFRELSHPRRVKDTFKHDYEIMKNCTSILNNLLDWYSISTKNYSIRRVSPKDFVFYQSWHSLPPNEMPFNYISAHFSTSAFSFEAPEKEGDLELMKLAESFEAMNQEYKLAYRLYIEARRSLEADNPQMAAIEAVASLETALSYYIKSQIEAKKDESGMKRISKNYYEDSKRDISLSIMLKFLFPLLIPPEVSFPKKELDACNNLRKSRNDAIHEPATFNSKQIESGLDAVEFILGFLVSQSKLTQDVDTV